MNSGTSSWVAAATAVAQVVAAIAGAEASAAVAAISSGGGDGGSFNRLPMLTILPVGFCSIQSDLGGWIA